MTETTAPTEETAAPAEETVPPTEETTPPTEPEETPRGWGLYFGQLHAHTTLSDGTGTVEEAFSYAAGVPGLDFLAVTDHSESLSASMDAVLTEDMTALSADWAAGKAAAAAVTGRDFVGIYGYEMSWPADKEIGHINTFNTPGFVSWMQPAYSGFDTALENYAAALAAVPGAVSQFNHPGPEFGDFRGFSRYSAAVDNVVQLLEVTDDSYYTQALDNGWHVAPTCSGSDHHGSWDAGDTGRTVVLAETLTEAGICEALGNHRAYATWDTDLHIYFENMGRRLLRRQVGEELTIRASLQDPTDPIGLVEVIGRGGAVLAAMECPDRTGEVSCSLPASGDYYYLRVTQPDGDRAFTAPIWLEGESAVGISGFSCETELPVQGKPLDFSLTVRNGSSGQLTVQNIEVFLGDELFHSLETAFDLPAGEEETYRFSSELYALGVAQIRASVTAMLDGEPRTYEADLSLSFRRDDMVTAILVDGAHGNEGLDALHQLQTLAADNRLALQILETPATAQMLAQGKILVITSPEVPFSEEFVTAVAQFALHGGTVILCGRSAAQDGPVVSARELNRISAAAGSTMILREDTVLDDTNNGGTPDHQYLTRFNSQSPWCAGLTEDHRYRYAAGCSVENGTWLVRGRETSYTPETTAPAVLCWDKCGEGALFAAGSLWLLDEDLAPGENFWALPYGNRTILEAILGIAAPELPFASIAEVRKGADGQVVTIRGYVTAGNTVPGNTFPDTIYLQDDTGGIAVTPFPGENIHLDTPMEITGYLETAGKNKQFHPISWLVSGGYPYRFPGITGTGRELMDPSLQGGRLLQATGIVHRTQLAEDGALTHLILRDSENHYITVMVEPYIRSGAYGVNDLADRIQPGVEVRATGLLHMDTDGASVLRVRNCDEVIVIDPWPYTKIRDKSNPNSGDHIGIWFALLGITAAPCAAASNVVFYRKRQKRRNL